MKQPKDLRIVQLTGVGILDANTCEVGYAVAKTAAGTECSIMVPAQMARHVAQGFTMMAEALESEGAKRGLRPAGPPQSPPSLVYAEDLTNRQGKLQVSNSDGTSTGIPLTEKVMRDLVAKMSATLLALDAEPKH
ncbi:hypothetical protein [uncultured Ramlibacter sp.]|uniref:hypothetical protein n=1 Tax=uncultured Ramlibacter sp. TaxID=260755 RepID=UPI002609CA3E|nr:hypothetical protein [uncultured Ramlibacter sp.]